MATDLSAADPQADVEPLRCILEIELGGFVSVVLLDACGAQDAHYAAGVVARCDAELTQLAVSHTRTRCPHESLHSGATTLGRQVNIYDAKSRLSRLVTDIERSRQGIVIARNGRPVAELVPLRHS
jgi:Antitoxin Phd_YefM, type II toxin-antitoxin system